MIASDSLSQDSFSSGSILGADADGMDTASREAAGSHRDRDNLQQVRPAAVCIAKLKAGMNRVFIPSCENFEAA